MRFEQIVVFIIGPLLGYLLCSIPFALVIGLSHGVDIRTVGSKNIGATNLGRTLGSRYFMHAFLLDAGKGLLPVLLVSLLAQAWNGNWGESYTHILGGDGQGVAAWTPLLTAVVGVFGHMHSIYLKFKGGKGVATTFGVILGFWPIFTLAGLAGATVFLLVFLGWRYISLSSIVGSATLPFFVIFFGHNKNPYVSSMYHEWSELAPILGVAIGLALMIAWKHRSNISRLLAGTELKAGKKR